MSLLWRHRHSTHLRRPVARNLQVGLIYRSPFLQNFGLRYGPFGDDGGYVIDAETPLPGVYFAKGG